MAEASELRVILSIAERLGEELGHTAAVVPPAGFPDPEHAEPSWGPADAENAKLVERLGRALAGIAAAAAAEAGEAQDEEVTESVMAALTRTKLVIRGQLIRGDEGALREQLPGFVFLVVLPGAGMDRALELASRAAALLEKSGGGPG